MSQQSTALVVGASRGLGWRWLRNCADEVGG
jgi:hypothetical protein